jgi:lysyl-tRNA synthetase class 2
MYLRIATELYLKRLIVGGFERVYELGRIFRNEGISYKHNPEFTTLELYQAYTDIEGMMEITERLFRHVFNRVLNVMVFNYEGHSIDISRPWRRVTMIDIVRETTGIDFTKLSNAQIENELEKFQCENFKGKTWGELLYVAFDQLVEKTLVQPTFVLDYPVEISPLAKRKASDARLVDRFEFFAVGRELGNAFSELNDPIDQRARFEAQMKEREKGNDEAHMLDEDFLNAIEYGMPPTGGLGVGIDRLVMLITNVHSIRECLLFPTMKPTKS